MKERKLYMCFVDLEIVRSKVDPFGICGKELCLMRCCAQCVRNGFTLDVPNRKKYSAVLRNSLSAEDVKILEMARKNQWRCCVMKWRL